MLTPDFLGEKGESRFKEICADAGIICNKSDRDRAGWDFILDFDFDGKNNLSLDRRIGPMSCHVQVKTVYSTTKNIRMKLNMAERLAKEVKPSFVYVMKVDDDLTVLDAFLIHMMGDRLAFVLRRLRKESASPTPSYLNKIILSITPNATERIGVSGKELVEALKLACGSDRDAYSKNKKRQLLMLGVQGFEAEISLLADNVNELSDILLGIKPFAPVTSVKTYERRFDVLLPISSFTKGSVSFSPEPQTKCRIIVRGKNAESPVVVNAGFYIHPALGIGFDARINVRNDLLHIDIFEKSEGLDADFKFKAEGQLAYVEDWRDFWEIRSFASNNDIVELEVDSKKFGLMLKTRFSGRPNEKQFFAFSSYMELCVNLINVNKKIINFPRRKTSWESIFSHYSEITFLSRLINNSLNSFVIPVDDFRGLITNSAEKVLVVGDFTIGMYRYAYYIVSAVVYDDEKKILNFSSASLRKLCISEEDYDEFVEDAKFLEGVLIVFHLKDSVGE